jgi:hypothetical protein
MSETEEKFTQIDEFQYPLLKPFNIAKTGDEVEATFIRFHAPTSKVIKQCAALKQAFFRAMQEQQDKPSSAVPDVVDQKQPEIFGHDVMNVIAISTQVDLTEVMEIAKQLFQAPNIALVEGEHKFGSAVIDRMSAEDLECALGEYLVNFILASALMRLKEKSLKE